MKLGADYVKTYERVKEVQIRAVQQLSLYVAKNGYDNILRVEPDEMGKTFIRDNNKLYVHADKEYGDKFRILGLESGLEFARNLAKFHRAAKGFVPEEGCRLKTVWGKRAQKYRELGNNLEKYVKNIDGECCNWKLQECTKCHATKLLSLERECIRIFKSEQYLTTLEQSMRECEISLNIVSNNTMHEGAGIYDITGIFMSGYGMVEEDIATLIKKVIEHTGDVGDYDKIMEEYAKYNDLKPNSDIVIRAFASFPEDSLKLVSKYMKCGKGEDCFPDKYKRYAQREQLCNLLGV